MTPTPELLANWADRITYLEAENARLTAENSELTAAAETLEGEVARSMDLVCYWRKRANDLARAAWVTTPTGVTTT